MQYIDALLFNKSFALLSLSHTCMLSGPLCRFLARLTHVTEIHPRHTLHSGAFHASSAFVLPLYSGFACSSDHHHGDRSRISVCRSSVCGLRICSSFMEATYRLTRPTAGALSGSPSCNRACHCSPCHSPTKAYSSTPAHVPEHAI